MLISLREWAKANGIDTSTARQRAGRGAFETAQKIGRNWVIDSGEKLVDHRKKELNTDISKTVFGIDENHKDVNKFVKAVIVNFGDERGDIIVTNDNFGTRRKYADFTKGKKKAGLHPNERYINQNDEICEF